MNTSLVKVGDKWFSSAWLKEISHIEADPAPGVERTRIYHPNVLTEARVSGTIQKVQYVVVAGPVSEIASEIQDFLWNGHKRPTDPWAPSPES